MLVAVAKANFPESKNLRKVSRRRSADELQSDSDLHLGGPLSTLAPAEKVPALNLQ